MLNSAPQRHLRTLPERIVEGSSRGTLTVYHHDEGETVTWAQVHADALSLAANLRDLGIGLGLGSHIAMLGPTSRQLVTALQATWLLGGCAVMLPLPMRLGSLDEFTAQTRVRIRNADCAAVLVDPDFAPFFVAEAGDPPVVVLDDVLRAPTEAAPLEIARVAREALAILQFTSGSTSAPKGVMLPHHEVCANLDAIAMGVELDRDVDVAVSWLPLYHDMGLIGLLLTPMTTGASLVLAGPQDFMGAPSRWMRWISRHRGSLTAGPNFSYVLAARALHREEQLDLSSLRMSLNGAEPVDPATVEAWLDAGERHGLARGAAFPAFGMAELTLAGAFPPVGRGLVIDTVDLAVLETERFAAQSTPGANGARSFVKLGRAVEGLELRIVDPDDGRVLVDREVGELEIRGTSVTPGYYKRPDATAAAFHDGWLRTGDLAYLVDEELVVCGRKKDVIIVGGRNVWPEDIERAVATVSGVRPGNVIAFGVPGRNEKEEVIVVCETKADPADYATVVDAVKHRVRDAVGLPAHDVVLIAPSSMPKTSSGKLQRSECKHLYLVGALETVLV